MISEITLTVEGIELECQVAFIHRPQKQATMWSPEEPAQMEVIAIECDEGYFNIDLDFLYQNSEQWRNHVDEQIWEVINA